MVLLPTLLLLSSPFFPASSVPWSGTLVSVCSFISLSSSMSLAFAQFRAARRTAAPQQVYPIPEAPHQLHISPTFPTQSQDIYNSSWDTRLQEAPSAH